MTKNQKHVLSPPLTFSSFRKETGSQKNSLSQNRFPFITFPK